VPGRAPPQKNRPVGYGVILADVRPESIENAFGAYMSGIALGDPEKRSVKS
jgi:hypothetical protein